MADTKPHKGEPQRPDTDDNSRVTKDHIALQNQGSVRADQYPKSERENQSLIRKDKKDKPAAD